MGADIIGWRSCPLQKELGPDGFLAKLKLRAYKSAVESQVPPEKREGVTIQVRINERDTKKLTYREIADGAEAFAKGIPECAACPISARQPLGCYHYINYPVDALAETLLFKFFTQPSQVAQEDSASDQIYQAVVSQVPSSGTGWHTQRGANGMLAELPVPLAHTWGGFLKKRRVDSAQLMQALFIKLEGPAQIAAYARFWNEFVDYANALQSSEVAASRTMAQIRALAKMMLLMTAVALTEGGAVLVDS